MENPWTQLSQQPKVAAALVRAQRNFAPAIKTATNPHFKSRYVDLAGCVEAVVDALNAEGIMLMQRTLPSDTGVIVETVFVHESGEIMSAGQLHVPAAKSDPQGYGSALTYARRYSLMAACGIAPEDDDGNAASAKITADQAATIQALAEEVGKSPAEISQFFRVRRLEDIPAARYPSIIATLEKRRQS